MSKTFTPIVITAKKARKDFETIKSRHADILRGMQIHSEKVKAYQEQKKIEQAQKQQIDMEREAQSKKDQMAHNKEVMAHHAKMQELEIKRKALSS